MQFLRQNVPGRLSSSCEELPVNEVTSRVHCFVGLSHISLVGLCERTPSKSFVGGDIEFLMSGAQGLSDAVQPYCGMTRPCPGKGVLWPIRAAYMRVCFLRQIFPVPENGAQHTRYTPFHGEFDKKRHTTTVVPRAICLRYKYQAHSKVPKAMPTLAFRI